LKRDYKKSYTKNFIYQISRFFHELKVFRSDNQDIDIIESEIFSNNNFNNKIIKEKAFRSNNRDEIITNCNSVRNLKIIEISNNKENLMHINRNLLIEIEQEVLLKIDILLKI